MRFTYLVPINHARKTTVSTEVQTNLQTGMPTLDDQNPLVSELERGFKTRMCGLHTLGTSRSGDGSLTDGNNEP